jgi:hypothetical protein
VDASFQPVTRVDTLITIERTRITNGPGPAFDQLRAIASGSGDPNEHAVRALLQADTGRFADARASVDALSSALGDALPLLPRFRPEVLRRFIDAKERR